MDGPDDVHAARAKWERQQRRVRRTRDLGLAVLALGVVVLAYAALLAGR